MRNRFRSFLKDIAAWSLLLILTGVVISLPFWNPYPMDLGARIFWWIFFGGAMVYIWVRFFRRV